MKLHKTEFFNCLDETGLIGIIRDNNAESAALRARAVLKGGARIIEVSLATPGALELIGKLLVERPAGTFIGAGTVLDAESAAACIRIGAQFIISPNFSAGLVSCCNRYGVPCIPGVGSVTEIVSASEAGADAVKLFPASVYGPSFIKAVKGPLPQARIIPVGGVSADNLSGWFEAGAYAVALGEALTHPKIAKDCADLSAAVAEHTQRIIEKVKAVKWQ